MRTLYIDCGMGAAGDMLTAALLELFPDKDAMLERLNSLGVPGVEYSIEKSVKCGITGTHVRVRVHGEEEHEHHHEHPDTLTPEHPDHHHHHHHHHSGMSDIEHLISHLQLSDKVKADAAAVYRLIAEAESKAHDKPVTEIHFHEVGTMDAVADVVAVCMLMDELKIDRVVTSPVHVGAGHVHCAHGILPVPAPATAHILRDVPIYGGHIQGELCTPTGAALLKYYTDEFGSMPVMRVAAIGYGMGTKEFEQANCVRVMLGGTEVSGYGGTEVSGCCGTDEVVKLECNIDDMSGEAYALACEIVLEAGALDVWTTQILMKKGRPAMMMSILLRPEDEERIVKLVFEHTSTIGIRKSVHERYTLDREIVELDGVRVKKSTGYGVTRIKPEFEDLKDDIMKKL